MDLSFFKNKSVFVTGHTGFKGAWLSFWLSMLGAKVTGFALPPQYECSLFEDLQLADHIQHIEGDIRDIEVLKSAMIRSKPEFVFHLAAQALVRKSYEDPILTFSTNVLGSANVLEAVRNCPSIRSFVYITSDKCYLNKEWEWGYRESDELGGPDPYSASKACAEHVFKSYYLSYFKNRDLFGCASVRAGNVIGGGDRSLDRIVPDVIKSMELNQPIVLRNPHATRPWQHVLDPLSGYLMLALRLYHNPQGLNGESWNFGPQSHAVKTVGDLVQRFIQHWGQGTVQVNTTTQSHPHEASLLHLSIDKAMNRLHWKPKYDVETAISKTSEWYKRVYQKESPSAVTMEHITAFMESR